MVAEIGCKMLEHLGYRVVSYSSGVDALEAFRADPEAFDLVITDMAMPQMTGDTFAKALLAMRPAMPIIICTGHSEHVGRSEAAAMGVNDFLMKPISLSELSRKVRKVLDGLSILPESVNP